MDPAANLLFAGDHVLPTITPSVGFEPAYAKLPLGDFLGSLAKVRFMPDMRLLPAHGPVTDSSHSRIDELLAHHDDRLRRCQEAVEFDLETAAHLELLAAQGRVARTEVDGAAEFHRASRLPGMPGSNQGNPGA